MRPRGRDADDGDGKEMATRTCPSASHQPASCASGGYERPSSAVAAKVPFIGRERLLGRGREGSQAIGSLVNRDNEGGLGRRPRGRVLVPGVPERAEACQAKAAHDLDDDGEQERHTLRSSDRQHASEGGAECGGQWISGGDNGSRRQALA
jgi:hypothetical protein